MDEIEKIDFLNLNYFFINIPVYRIKYYFKPNENLTLRNNWGITLRGSLGYLLKDHFCKYKDIKCKNCSIKSECPYSLMFEDNAISKSSVPKPFIIKIPNLKKLEKGNTYHFEIVYLNSLYKNIIPISKEIIKNLNKYFLNKDEIQVYKAANIVAPNIEIDSNHLKKIQGFIDNTGIDKSKRSYRIISEKPLKIDRIDFENINSVLNLFLLRIKNLKRCCSDLKDIPYIDKDLIRRFKIKVNKAKMIKDYRNSNRQKRQMQLNLNNIDVEILGNEIYKIYPILRYVEIVSLGRNTSMGFGEIKII